MNLRAKQHVFIIGSKGIPAKYGGFETFVEKLTQYQKCKTIQYHVACAVDRSDYNGIEFEYNGSQCFNIKRRKIGPASAVFYDVDAIKWCIRYVKDHHIKQPIVYVLACRMGPFFRYFVRRINGLGGKVFINPDGHEWLRAKWSVPVKKYWKYSEKLMVQHADLIICDSKNIEKYIQDKYLKYNPRTSYIAYGADNRKSTLPENDPKLLDFYDEKKITYKSYFLVVGRFVPENNYEIMIREYMRSNTNKDFVIVTNVSEKFQAELKKRTGYDRDARIKFVGTVYDAELLKKIRENAYGYFHGHEVGGTNPSLLEALASTDLNLLIDVSFNREVAEIAALYWNKDAGNLANLIDKVDQLGEDEIKNFGEKAKLRIAEAFTWEYIVDEYEDVFQKNGALS